MGANFDFRRHLGVTGSILVFWKHHGFGAYLRLVARRVGKEVVQGRLQFLRTLQMESCGVAIGQREEDAGREDCGDGSERMRSPPAVNHTGHP